jgi:hypothetical protein
MLTGRSNFAVGVVGNVLYAIAGETLTVQTNVNEAYTVLQCDVTYDGVYRGDLTVSSGRICVNGGGTVTGNLLQTGGSLSFMGGKVSGNLTQNGGSLMMTGGTVHGDLQVTGSGTSSINGSNVGGNLVIQNLLTSAGPDQVCGTVVGNDLQSHNNAAAIVIGSPSASPSCAGNTIGGNLQVQNNAGATQVSGNIVTGNLQCNGNTAISGSANTAKQKQGQCATY